MKYQYLLLPIFFALIVDVQYQQTNPSHICFESNESVVKFRKKVLPQSKKQALQYCVADKIVGQHGILLDWPIDLCDFWVSSLFGPRTYNGVTKMHEGVDLAALKGTMVKAAASGVISQADSMRPGYGGFLEIQHDAKFKTRYAHLDELLVRSGQRVKKGDPIGTVGATGRVRGKKDPSHLHFEVLKIDPKSSKYVKENPLLYLYCAEVAFAAK